MGNKIVTEADRKRTPPVKVQEVSVVARAGGGRSDRLVSVGFLYQTGRLLP